MNDFTKDELKTLSDILTLDLDDINPSCQEELQNKLQFMIDNYCEHKSNPQFGDINYIEKCARCGKLTGYS